MLSLSCFVFGPFLYFFLTLSFLLQPSFSLFDRAKAGTSGKNDLKRRKDISTAYYTEKAEKGEKKDI